MRRIKRTTASVSFIVSLLVTAAFIRADDDASPADANALSPQELGTIAWRRGFDSAADESKRTGRPLLVLFQEVPGCSTCKGYGDRVLSHPLIRDAAESCFVPVAIYNNIHGDDERVLKAFNEPAWNNPVVRIMRYDRTELTSRIASDYTANGLVAAMVASLEKAKRQIPVYLQLLNDELSARKRGLERATFAMHCFWEGEGQLGAMDGVIATLPGFVQGREVVDVWFDADRLPYLKLATEARKLKCASAIFTHTDGQYDASKSLAGLEVIRTDDNTRADKEPKYFMSKTPYRFVPMTETQASRVNGAIRAGKSAESYLSPRQLALLAVVRAHPDADWPDAIRNDDLVKALAEADRIASKATAGR
ncbi:MAG: hypothetical protein H6818_19805 [Phycisphaerales bacterium]|nr:hypothetical protein [Phycisphaerales bacterium]